MGLIEEIAHCADRVGRLHSPELALFGILLTEIGLVEVRVVAERIGSLLEEWSAGGNEALLFSCGLAALEDDADRRNATAASLLAASERCRRLAGRPQRGN